MQTILLCVSSLRSSRLAYGCWRVAGSWDQTKVTSESRAAGHRAIIAAYEAGYTLMDNADIYSGGEAENILGEVLKQVSGMRSRVLIATKCGIRPAGTPHPKAPQRYDFSGAHIVESCEQSLKRLRTDCISRAARTARRGSSSCATGAPKVAMTASPRNLSTSPP